MAIKDLVSPPPQSIIINPQHIIFTQSQYQTPNTHQFSTITINMKASVVFILPLSTLALAAATAKVEERQATRLPGLPLNPQCLAGIPGITNCLSGPVNPNTLLSDLVGCPLGVIVGALACVLS
ncbi:hypothetical protein NM208_g8424 [Fusarium decemcellulare]|uniref:Uncharacterized protein n=1 Tax=Fusarium decemcellulare TaxID=57161 RepID=A0ACC1S5C8_9HYPO|nr:hypothetical protein NM208_g8424 [Fusarium decemcellulare]